MTDAFGEMKEGERMRLSLTRLVVLAIGVGVISGGIGHTFIRDPALLAGVEGGLNLVTIAFLRAIKMIIAPLVLTTLISGIARISESAVVGRIAGRAMLWFLGASCISIAIGFSVVEVLKPGVGLHLRVSAGASAMAATPLTPESFLDRLIPMSIADAMARNEVLQIVIFSVIAGMAMSKLGTRAAPVLALVESLADVMLKMTSYIIRLAPVVVFAAIAEALVAQGLGIIATYAAYVGAFYVALAIVWCAMGLAGASALGVSSLRRLLKGVREPALIALSTTSVEAAYPVLLQRLEEFGVSNKIASFVLPLGYAFNLVGSMCYCVFSTLFLAQAYDVTLNVSDIAILILLLFVTSKGIANVPRASLLVVASVLPHFRIPEAGLLLVLGVDHILDMGRSATNAVGNAIVVASVSRWERSPGDEAP